MSLEIGGKIRKLRTERKLTLRQVAEKIGIDYAHLSKIERGQVPSLSLLEAIANFFEVDMAYFVGKERHIPSDIENKIEKWYSFIEESEKLGYSPEDLLEIAKTIKNIQSKK